MSAVISREEWQAGNRSLRARRRAAAFHEAGHAVVRIVRLGTATGIDIHDDGSGYSHGSGDTCRATDDIEITLAGPLAEARARKVSLLAVTLTGGSDDWDVAEADAKRLADAGWPKDYGSILSEAEKNARRWLRMYWDSVERVAAAVLASSSGSLTGAEVSSAAGCLT